MSTEDSAVRIFFSPPFVVLHDEILSLLALDPTIHTCLPLLGVSRYWRELVLEKLVAPFSEAAKNGAHGKTGATESWPVLGQDDFLMHIVKTEPYFGNEDPDSETVDLRQYFSPPTFYFLEQGLQRKAIVLSLSHYDSGRRLCTFKPVTEALGKLDFRTPCYEPMKPFIDVAAESHYTCLSGAWFRASDSSSKSRQQDPDTENDWDVELAAAPNRFPPRALDFIADPPLGETATIQRSVKFFRAWKGWKASWRVERHEQVHPTFSFMTSGAPDIHCTLTVRQVTCPLLDLYRPPETHSTDPLDPYEDESDEDYGEEEAEEQNETGGDIAESVDASKAVEKRSCLPASCLVC
ncbi:hypothetical protein P7C70_g2743, partial [Phenoliferia sp. Uapishka_3]